MAIAKPDQAVSVTKGARKPRQSLWQRLFGPKNPSVNVSQTISTDGLYHQTWERKRMPSPGAPAYAWETLGLVLFSPIGPSVVARQQRYNLGPSSLYQKAVPITGLPTVTGTLVHAPLVNPDSPGFALSFSGMINDPFPPELTQAAGRAL